MLFLLYILVCVVLEIFVLFNRWLFGSIRYNIFKRVCVCVFCKYCVVVFYKLFVVVYSRILYFEIIKYEDRWSN